MPDAVFYVYREVGDEDGVLFVGSGEPSRNHNVVFTGGQKACRKYVLDHQSRGRAKSLRKLPPYETS